MPTESGLRLFVDAMMQVAEPTEQRARRDRAAYRRAGTDRARARTDQRAAVGPLGRGRDGDGAAARTAAGADLADTRSTPIACSRCWWRRTAMSRTASSSSRRRALGTSLEQASNYLTARSAGRTLAEALAECRTRDRHRPHRARRCQPRPRLARACHLDAGCRRAAGADRPRPGQAARRCRARRHRAGALAARRSRKQAIGRGLLENARDAEATRIFIGSENRLFSLSGSSVIAAPYRDRDGKVVGVLGVIGPTRLNYARVVPMVDFTARQLGKRIG